MVWKPPPNHKNVAVVLYWEGKMSETIETKVVHWANTNRTVDVHLFVDDVDIYDIYDDIYNIYVHHIYSINLNGLNVDEVLIKHKRADYDVNMYDRIDLFRLLSAWVLLETYGTVFCIDVLKPLVAEIPRSIIDESKSVIFLTPIGENWLMVCSSPGRDTILQLIKSACQALPTVTSGYQQGLYTRIWSDMGNWSGVSTMWWLENALEGKWSESVLPVALQWCQERGVTKPHQLNDNMIEQLVDALDLKRAPATIAKKRLTVISRRYRDVW